MLTGGTAPEALRGESCTAARYLNFIVFRGARVQTVSTSMNRSRRSDSHVPAFALVAIAFFSSAAGVRCQTLTVPGSANIFGAGHASPPAPAGGGAGQLPPMFSFAAGSNQILTFSSVTGSVRVDFDDTPGGSNGPDGGTIYTRTDVFSFGGISGIINNQRTMFLVGVFVGPTEPTDPAPARLDFSNTGLTENFSSLSPALNQVFFIGDGLTGTGSGVMQQFLVPSGATRLYLGFADAFDPGSNTISGQPGFYGDNDGAISATFAIVPEPSSLILSVLAVLVVGGTMRKRAGP